MKKKDPANNDPFTEGGEHGFIGKAVVQYNIVFDDETQLKDFYKFIKGLKTAYPETRTIGGRIAEFLRSRVIETQEWKDHLAALPSAGKVKDVIKPTTV